MAVLLQRPSDVITAPRDALVSWPVGNKSGIGTGPGNHQAAPSKGAALSSHFSGTSLSIVVEECYQNVKTPRGLQGRRFLLRARREPNHLHGVADHIRPVVRIFALLCRRSRFCADARNIGTTEGATIVTYPRRRKKRCGNRQGAYC